MITSVVNLQEPLRKGNALGLGEREFITVDEAHDAFERLTAAAGRTRLAAGGADDPVDGRDQGHIIVVEPNGNAQAWPVNDQPDLFQRLGRRLASRVSLRASTGRGYAAHVHGYLFRT